MNTDGRILWGTWILNESFIHALEGAGRGNRFPQQEPAAMRREDADGGWMFPYVIAVLEMEESRHGAERSHRDGIHPNEWPSRETNLCDAAQGTDVDSRREQPSESWSGVVSRVAVHEEVLAVTSGAGAAVIGPVETRDVGQCPTTHRTSRVVQPQMPRVTKAERLWVRSNRSNPTLIKCFKKQRKEGHSEWRKHREIMSARICVHNIIPIFHI